jgi:hypothetical protein
LPIRRAWTPDQLRTTPQARRAAQHPGSAKGASLSRAAQPSTRHDCAA